MTPDDSQTATIARLRCALSMFDFGRAMMLERMRREFPADSERDRAVRLQRWMSTRPGAEHGDAQGKPLPVPHSDR